MPETLVFSVYDAVHEVAIKRHAQARRLTLRVDHARCIRLTVPTRCSDKRMLLFLNDNRDWLQQQLGKTPAGLALKPGTTFPLRGVPHLIVHEGTGRGITRAENDFVYVHGNPAHLPRRLRDFLKKEAKSDLEDTTARHASTLGVRVRRIQLRDPSTRWGSCSRNGTISYSWRLIFAPPFVLDYLCAHEVAHLRHMDHSKKFWILVEEIFPRTDEARKWLKENGAMLLAIG